jgi:hypothetical protein
MHDSEFKKLLLETCPVRPGQESRAWAALKNRLYQTTRPCSGWSWLYYPTWRGLAVAALALALIPIVRDFIAGSMESGPFATADSQSPGIYATAFYSRTAQAQVVWLNGMEPATDKPTYLDPTTVVAGATDTPPPARDPNSL